MSLPQQKYREIVFQLLYSLDIGNPKEEDIISLLMKELSVTKVTMRQAWQRAQSILSHKKEIDNRIRQTAVSYEFDRIQVVERTILRLGVFELFHDPNIPPKVAISEAMRLARKFSTPEAASFVNALLDHLYKGEKSHDQILSDTIKSLEESEERSKELRRSSNGST